MEAYGFLWKIREEKQISRERLAAGICAPGILERFEMGEQEIDRETLNIVLGRLGISQDKVEVVFCQEEYECSDALYQFEEYVYQKKGEEALALLAQYIEPKAETDLVWKMYDCRCRAMYERYIGMDYKRAETYLFHALKMTLPDWMLKEMQSYILKFSLKDCLVSSVEMENLMALAELWLLGKERKLAEIEKWLEKCRKYIKKTFLDEEERAKVLCKCLWLQADSMIRQGRQQEAFLRCEEALELLRDCGISYFMLPLMERMLSCKEATDLKRHESRLKEYCDSLRYVSRLVGGSQPEEASIYHNCNKQECHLDREIFRQERTAKGLTQEQVCEGIFSSARPLSEMERGKQKLRKKNYEQLMKRFGLKKGRFHFHITTDSFKMLELDNEFSRMLAKEQLQDMEKIINRLKSQLDMGIPENRRVIRTYEIVLDWKKRNRPWEELLNEAVELLEETYEIRRGCYRVPFLEEAQLIVNIAILLKMLNREEEEKQLYWQMLRVYRESRISERYHFLYNSTIYNNLSRNIVSEELAMEGLYKEYECGKLNTLYFKVLVIATAWIKRGKEEDEHKQAVKRAYWLCELAKNYTNCDKIRRNYQKIYKEDIFD